MTLMAVSAPGDHAQNCICRHSCAQRSAACAPPRSTGPLSFCLPGTLMLSCPPVRLLKKFSFNQRRRQCAIMVARSFSSKLARVDPVFSRVLWKYHISLPQLLSHTLCSTHLLGKECTGPGVWYCTPCGKMSRSGPSS